ncbi:MAG: chemotaxis protein CheW [Beggiatoa sp. IS2]|nr:MAG: chemotaxis protein CheW [Beggiatoa sp. IS2]
MSNAQKVNESFILFELGKTSYGIPSRLVQQMEMLENVTPVPNAPHFVEGITLSRGQVIPLINLRKCFGFEKISHDMKTRLIVVNVNGRTVGFIVDTAREFVMIQSDTIQPPPEQIVGLSGQYLEGIAMLNERLVLLLNIEEVIKVETFTQK